ncbi:hypothetical protein QQP08_007887 [Theobroma cacao]|nr:hypothetical protein QQP08_007887 [Theobroma cacao]
MKILTSLAFFIAVLFSLCLSTNPFANTTQRMSPSHVQLAYSTPEIRENKHPSSQFSGLGSAVGIELCTACGAARLLSWCSCGCGGKVLVDGNFVSCKELSAYLQSCFGGLHDAHLTLDKDGDIAQQVHQMVSENVSEGGIVQKEDDRRRSDEHEKEVNLLGIDNLAEV